MTGRREGWPGASVCPGGDTAVFARLAASLTWRWGAAGYGALSLSLSTASAWWCVCVCGGAASRAAFLFFLFQLKGWEQSLRHVEAEPPGQPRGAQGLEASEFAPGLCRENKSVRRPFLRPEIGRFTTPNSACLPNKVNCLIRRPRPLEGSP